MSRSLDRLRKMCSRPEDKDGKPAANGSWRGSKVTQLRGAVPDGDAAPGHGPWAGGCTERRLKRVADVWCASFLWPQHKGAPAAITANVFRAVEKDEEDGPLPDERAGGHGDQLRCPPAPITYDAKLSCSGTGAPPAL